MISTLPFGHLPSGKEVNAYTITNSNGVSVTAINFGGIITSIVVPDKHGAMGDIVLGYSNLEDYLNDTHYIGEIIGRNANRIANAQFELDGSTYQLASNNGTNCHHGGLLGFNKQFWEIEPITTNEGESMVLTYTSPDGEEGFPGTLSVVATYTLTTDNRLVMEYRATTDKATVVNLSHHSYFNLSAGVHKDMLSHELQLFASHYLPVDNDQLPTAELAPVVNTPMDFRYPKTIGNDIDAEFEQLEKGRGFDHTWVVDGYEKGGLNKAALLFDPESGRTLEISTTEPGIQFYSGNFLNGMGSGKKGFVNNHRSGMGLETQHFPNSINTATFPSVVLRPGEVYLTKTVYLFGVKIE